MQNPAVFFDRDGTINEDPGYLGDPDKVKLFPNTAEALLKLKQKSFKLIVISNQSGIARGLIKKDDVESVNEKINELLKEKNIQFDAFYFCPFHPDYNTEEECLCRKPSPQMVLNAAKDFNIDLSKSYFVGDNLSDIQCGENAGVKTVLVKTGHGNKTLSILQKENKFPSFVAENLIDACNFIIRDFSGEKFVQ